MPLEPSGRGTFFLWPPRAPLKPPLEPQRLPPSTQGTHMSSQGLHQTCKVSTLETMEISLFGSQDLKKTISSFFFTLQKLSRDPTKWAPIFCRSSQGAQNAPRELPGTPKEHPGPPDDTIGPPCKFQSVHLRNKNRRLSGFTHISHVFDELARAIAPLQICPGQLLHIFPSDIENSIHRRHLRESPLGPSGYPPKPSRTFLKAPRDPKESRKVSKLSKTNKKQPKLHCS